MIYTSYFAKLRKMPEDVVPIAICKYPPKWYDGLAYKRLAPPANLISAWKNGEISMEDYIHIYTNEILNKNNPDVVVSDLIQMANEGVIVLLCFENSEEFCHRHLVAEWLDQAGYPCEELNI